MELIDHYTYTIAGRKHMRTCVSLVSLQGMCFHEVYPHISALSCHKRRVILPFKSPAQTGCVLFGLKRLHEPSMTYLNLSNRF